jgi:hypothetical protein
VKNSFLYVGLSFVRSAVTQRNNISGNGEKGAYIFASSVYKKNFSSIGLTVAEKMVHYSSFFDKKLNSRKTQNNVERYFSIFRIFYFSTYSYQVLHLQSS